MKRLKIILILVNLILLSSCASYTISKESLIEQVVNNQDIKKNSNISSLGVNYFSNNIKKIMCVDKNGINVNVYSSKNMTFKIKKMSDSKVITMYFDTVIFQNDTLFGLQSRIIGGKIKIAVDDILKIEIKAENPVVEIIK